MDLREKLALPNDFRVADGTISNTPKNENIWFGSFYIEKREHARAREHEHEHSSTNTWWAGNQCKPSAEL